MTSKMKTCINMEIILITIRKMHIIMIGKLFFFQDYTSYSNANSYNYCFR